MFYGHLKICINVFHEFPEIKENELFLLAVLVSSSSIKAKGYLYKIY